ncbi:hypothetical protein Lal_00050137 [Lupinus albus]|uniref:Putative pectinesterase inhibitor domain-containing protein n=1 Tax=Lupinus albus TaxID=3870 RepID=A0A6A5LZ62_LUPAL|nr:putative pectinesterase inhibitor domain-containing protein [Lupinus albus]KAF1867704.1 hypothetical protein Lal_00050137 [Lupinus albus]
MTTFNSLTIFFFLCILISIPSSQCRTFQINDESLIERTCKKTPYFNVCIESLKSSPGSSSATLRGLALIMVDVTKAKANEALNIIHVLESAAGTEAKKGLESCASKYNTILVVDLPNAIKALKIGDGKSAEKLGNNAAKEATNCETEFNGTLTSYNNAVHDVAAVAAAIARQLYTN